MGVEQFARRNSLFEWRKHLRPWGKRVANGIVRQMDRKLIAEFDEPRGVGDDSDESEFDLCYGCNDLVRSIPVTSRFRGRTFCQPCERAWRATLVA